MSTIFDNLSVTITAVVASMTAFVTGRMTARPQMILARTSEMDRLTSKYAELADRAERAANRAEDALKLVQASEHECRSDLQKVMDRLAQLEREPPPPYHLNGR